jgi:DNA mismatch repair protein MutS2
VALGVRKAGLDRALEALRPQGAGEPGGPPPLGLDPKEGDQVFIRKLGRPGVVVSWNPAKGEGLVESRNVRVRAELAELGPDPGGGARAKAALNVLASPGGPGEPALKLLGYTVDEALLEIDQEIGRALRDGRDRLTIIHGLGTGRLKAGITGYLRRHPRVRAFGSPNAPGGAGVTEVELEP